MPCFGSKRVEVVPCTTEDGATDEHSSKSRASSAKGRKGAGRLESEGKEAPAARDGLHSAPTSQDASLAGDTRRQGLHSAPHAKKADKGAEAAAVTPAEPIGDFILEASDGNQPTAAAVDAYLDDIIGTRIVKQLRDAEWASRVSGLEALQQLVKRRATDAATATGQEMPDPASEHERGALFRACVTVMTRALQDKVVPVYLPALALLAEVYSPPFLGPIAHGKLPKAAIGCFAHQLVFRSGSSNVRAREESSSALLSLARCDAAGCPAVAPWALRPVSNTKSAHAAVGRLELLRTLVAEFGLGEPSGLLIKEVLAFSLPLCECAAKESRDAAIGLVLDVRATDPQKTERLIEEIRPSVLPTINARLAPPETKGSAANALSVSGKRLPPLAPIPLQQASLPGRMPLSGDEGEELLAVHGTPPEASSRARARTTATELGARNAPPPKKKAPKRAVAHGATPRAPADDEDGLLAEANSLLGAVDMDDGPRPVRLAGGNAGVSPSKHSRRGAGGHATASPRAAGGGDDPDEVSKFLTEEQLMQEILEQTR